MVSSPVSQVPDGLQERGRALWSALGRAVGTPEGVLALEACRIADRLDEFDRLIAGKGVLNLLQFRLDLDLGYDDRRNVEVTVKIQGVLAEARQHAVALGALLARLGLDAVESKPTEEGSPLAQVLALVQPPA